MAAARPVDKTMTTTRVFPITLSPTVYKMLGAKYYSRQAVTRLQNFSYPSFSGVYLPNTFRIFSNPSQVNQNLNVSCSHPVPVTGFMRSFSCSRQSLAKKEKETTTELPTVDLKGEVKALKDLLQHSLDQFTTKAKQLKRTGPDLNSFKQLVVELDHQSRSTIQDIATVALRGNKVMIVAHDPNQVKYIQTTILKNLGVPAEAQKSDKQTLLVNIPSESNERVQERERQLKELYESFRHSPNSISLSSLRFRFLAPYKKNKVEGSEAELRKQTKHIESLVKDKTAELEKIYRQIK